ncbi:MAG TPA: aspartate aminotransferase family protein [Candidatus Baltobacteraceae bacterium]|nr:aspartate aminotransferase family protein [Candidatus Baltobacteraceae bacterium]
MSSLQTGTGESHLLGNYNPAPVTIVRGEGCELIDENGERYLDFVAGIAVCALGHARPEITAAIAEQAGTLVHCSNLYRHEPSMMLAGELARRSGFERVFFCNSGAEANEAAIKLARKLAYRRGEGERRTILACEGSFHGRTFGALAATANRKYQEGFEPLPLGFRFTPFNDVAALEKALDETVAAFLVEPVQGESGIKPADPDFLAAARKLCDARGALLIFDEIQCGMGRLGTLFAFETFGVRPDALTMAKALANGLPIGAMLVAERFAGGLQKGDHGTTFGGSPVPCAAALEHLKLRDRLDLDAQVREVGAILWEGLTRIAEDMPAIFCEPRGRGMMLGLPVAEPYEAAHIVDVARELHHLLINAAGDNTIRIVPPLVLSPAQARDGLKRLRSAAASAA